MSTEQNPNPEQPPEGQPPESGTENPNREAAQRRRQLREAEAERDAAFVERDTLRERVDTYQRREIAQHVSDRLNNPDDLWLMSSLDAVRGEDGEPDLDRLDAEIKRVLADKPHWRKGFGALPVDMHQGPRRDVPMEGPSFGETMKRSFRGM